MLSALRLHKLRGPCKEILNRLFQVGEWISGFDKAKKKKLELLSLVCKLNQVRLAIFFPFIEKPFLPVELYGKGINIS